jgi:hypothetical protein
VDIVRCKSQREGFVFGQTRQEHLGFIYERCFAVVCLTGIKLSLPSVGRSHGIDEKIGSAQQAARGNALVYSPPTRSESRWTSQNIAVGLVGLPCSLFSPCHLAPFEASGLCQVPDSGASLYTGL